MNIKQGMDSAKQQIIDNILGSLPASVETEITLPSEAKLYTLIDQGLPITLRPMTFEDERALISSDKNSDPVNLLLGRCVKNINIGDLLPMDKLYLLMKLREISYGNEYKTTLICQHCKFENISTIKLSELAVTPVPDDFKEPVEVTLPKIGKIAKVRFPRVRDERYLLSSEDIFNNLWRFVTEIDGHQDKSIISAVIDKLPLVDMKTITNALKVEYGLDTKVKLVCSKCEGTSLLELPLNANFFNVN